MDSSRTRTVLVLNDDGEHAKFLSVLLEQSLSALRRACRSDPGAGSRWPGPQRRADKEWGPVPSADGDDRTDAHDVMPEHADRFLPEIHRALQSGHLTTSNTGWMSRAG